MSGIITVASTTDSQAEVEKAAQHGEPTLPFPEEETTGPSEVDETETAAEPEPAESPEIEEEEPEEPEEEPESPEAPEAQPSKRQRERGLVAQIKRQAAQIEELRELVRKSLPAPAEAPKPEALKRPDSTDPKYRGKGIEDVAADVYDFKEQEKKAAQEREKQEALERENQEWVNGVLKTYNQRLDEAEQNYPDYRKLVEPVRVGQLAYHTLVRIPNPGEVWYHLGKNPGLVEQLDKWDVSKDPADANRIVQSLQNLSDQLSGKPKASAPLPSSSSSPSPRPAAPRPLRHVGGASTATSVDPEKFKSQREYNDWRNAGGGR